MINVRCPCCKGKKELRLEDHRRRVTWVHCCHCDGLGTVPAEPVRPESDEQRPVWTELMIVTAHSPPGLKRYELSRAVKRDHLLSIKVAPDDAAKILDELYGPEAA